MRGVGGLGDLAQEKGQREGAGAAAGDPQTVHGAHPIPTPPAWGPTSPLTHTFPPFHVSAHFPQTVLHTRVHTHTHPSFPMVLPLSQPSIHTNAKCEPRGVWAGLDQTDSPPDGALSLGQLGNRPPEAVGLVPLGGVGDSVGKWETWRLRTPGGGRDRSARQHKGTGGQRGMSQEPGKEGELV